VPDGIVNDRWVPWHPLLGAARFALVRRAIDALSRRQARRDGGLVPPLPPHFDYRTPEYVTFQDVPQHSWECVRGMDKSFGYNACSRPEHFIAHEELLSLLSDIVAKGGNLLLNVGPRGVDASIPDEQLARLDWLAQWVGPNREALFGTRPWVYPGSTTAEGKSVRYTAREETVFAILANAAGSATLTEVRSTATTSVTTMGGESLSWRDMGHGLVIDLPASVSGPEPLVLALHHVRAG
jgi:alpha-L-fucosidase